MFQAKYFPALHKKMETQMYDMINNREENILPDPNLEGAGGGEVGNFIPLLVFP